ncbi:helix-turn-helix domain-containing protein [Echinicola jeungdonensis]|uniref:Helix-turn-helix domain-containing protein n=1 Tax=Echinicola jeungdonensis TaxID=709343 RepID=A0ABV5J2T2_9BACT|nr:helix-turn-helix domain-containing protein [Echinicola jeungdonensis]MDN3667981.1 helix-turn-helix domain-containing protein [Echinicola jeungdonensis]
MSVIKKIKSISELHAMLGYEKPKHPLITFVDLTKVNAEAQTEEVFLSMDFYAIVCKSFEGTFRYGRSIYDFQEGSLIFTAPGQVMSSSPDLKITEGWALYFHPDLMYGTDLAKRIKEYSFFHYEANEALHISDEEKTILETCVHNIEREYHQNTDHHTQELIVDSIQLMLNYSKRFYQRQFITRKKVNSGIIERFESLLREYINENSLIESGLPSVTYFADQLNLSPTYLTDVLKSQTGKNSQEHIHLALVDKAKTMLLGTTKSVSEVAYDLGFDYPSHFSKLFKSKTGKSPSQYRMLN